MAGFQVGDIVAITFSAEAFAQRILNTITYRCTAAGAPSDTIQSDSQFIGALVKEGGAADMVTKIGDINGNAWAMNEVVVQDVFPIRYRSFATSSIGAGTAGPSPRPNVSGVITRRTNISGRDQVSSLKFGPTADADVAGGFMTADWLERAQIVADAFEVVLAGATTLRLEPVIWHRTIPFTGTYYTRVSDCVPQSTSRVIRRRTVGLGI